MATCLSGVLRNECTNDYLFIGCVTERITIDYKIHAIALHTFKLIENVFYRHWREVDRIRHSGFLRKFGCLSKEMWRVDTLLKSECLSKEMWRVAALLINESWANVKNCWLRYERPHFYTLHFFSIFFKTDVLLTFSISVFLLNIDVSLSRYFNELLLIASTYLYLWIDTYRSIISLIVWIVTYRFIIR